MRELILNSGALKHNLEQIKTLQPGSKILAMLKADAYGHGLEWVAEQLKEESVSGFAVADLIEAHRLKKLNLNLPIVLMSGVTNLTDLKTVIDEGYELVIHHEIHISLLEQLNTNKKIKLWIKIDSGMHRLGFSPEAMKEIGRRLLSLTCIAQPVVLITHFSDANEINQLTTAKQIMLFHLVCDQFPKSIEYVCSLANSAGILSRLVPTVAWIRPGIILYGVSPFLEQNRIKKNLQAVMTVRSKIISINKYSAGAAIGYGGTYICPSDKKIAVVAFGYGDGYPWSAKNSQVLIKGRLFYVVGRISMDMLQVDLNDAEDIKVGDSVTLWGEGLPVENLAKSAGTIPYEITCRMPRHRMKIIFL